MKTYFGELDIGDCFIAYANTYMRIESGGIEGDEFNAVCLVPLDDSMFGELAHFWDSTEVDTVMFHPNFERIDDEI